MAFESLQDYLRALNTIQRSTKNHKFKAFHVCPNLSDIISSSAYISTTSIHTSRSISDFTLKGNVKKTDTDQLEFFLETKSLAKCSDICLKWSASIYNEGRDNYLKIGESCFNINNTLISSTSEKLCICVDSVINFLQNNQFVVVWFIEFITSSDCKPDFSNSQENVASGGDISQEIDFDSMVDAFFARLSNRRLHRNQGEHETLLEDISKTIDQCREQALLNRKDIALIKQNVFEVERRVNDLLNPLDDIHNRCCRQQCSDAVPLTAKQTHFTDVPLVSNIPLTPSHTPATSDKQLTDLNTMSVSPRDLRQSSNTQTAEYKRKLPPLPLSSSPTPPPTTNLLSPATIFPPDNEESKICSRCAGSVVSQQYWTSSEVDSGYECPDGFQSEYYQTIPVCRQGTNYQSEYQYDRSRYLYEMPQFEIDLLLIGKTGQGNSALGNSILRRQAFESKACTTTLTKTVADGVSEYRGILIKVVDTPGVGNTDLSDEEAKNMIVESLSGSISINPRGFHAFLLVSKFGDRYTKESKLAVEVLKKVFGESFVKKFCILVMTYGDQYEGDTSFKDWVNDQKGDLAALVKECDNRVILFDNKTQDRGKREGQLKALIDMVVMLTLKNGRYTNDQFQLAKKSRQALMLETRKLAIEEEAINEASLILNKLQSLQADTKNVSNTKSCMTLDQLSLRTINLLEKLKEEDKGTGVLNEIIHHVKTLHNSINDETRLVKRISQLMENISQKGQRVLAERIRHQRKEFYLIIAGEKIQGPVSGQNTDLPLPELSGEDVKTISKMIVQWKNSNDLDADLKQIKTKKKNFILKAIQCKVFTAMKKSMTENRKS